VHQFGDQTKVVLRCTFSQPSKPHKRPDSLSQKSAQKHNISLTGHFLHIAVTLLFSTKQLESPTVRVTDIVSEK